MSKVKGSISGRVKDSQNSLPLQNVQVSIVGSAITPVNTAGDGSFMILDVPAGTYSLYFIKLDAASLPDPTYSTYTAAGVQVISTDIKVVDDVFLSTSFSSISGVMYLETNGISGYQSNADKPLSDITVTATQVGGTLNYPSTTSPDGKYNLTNMQLGNYELKFTASAPEGYYALPVTVNLPNTTAVTKDIQMQAKQGDITA
jgi:Cna protein B-type domain.